MRTLKKTLALVLCLAMIAGLCCFGTSAAFADAAEIEYTEAADVMNAIGVLKGDGTNFNPKGILTRAEAAVIMAKLLGGDKMTSTSTYKDMKGFEWAQSYAAFCEQQGIILGDGKGNFFPGQELTGYQFGLMLIRALGYKPAEEGVESATYEIGTAVLMKEIGLDLAVANFDGTAPLTREKAAALALQALQSTMVKYTGGVNITTGNTTATIGATRSNVSAPAYSYKSNGAAVATADMQLCEKYFPNLKLDVTGEYTDFGAASKVWFLGTSATDYVNAPTKQITEVATATVLATYTTGIEKITQADLYNLTGVAGTIDIIENGTDSGADATAAKGVATPVFASYKGAKVEIVDQDLDGNADAALVTYAYLAQVSAVTAATPTTDRFVTLTVYSDTDHVAVTGVTYTTDEFALNDYVLVYPNNKMATTEAWANTVFNTAGNILKVEAIAPVTGKVASVAGTNGTAVTDITVDGTKYPVAVDALAPMGVTYGVKDTTYTLGTASYDLYLANGYVIGVVGTPAAKTIEGVVYALVSGTGVDQYGVATYPTQVVLTDGTTAIYNATSESVDVDTAGLFKATLNPVTGTYAFTSVDAYSSIDNSTVFYGQDTVASTTAMTEKTTSLALTGATKGYITANTQLIFVSGTGAALKVTTATGAMKQSIASGAKVLLSKTVIGANYEVEAIIIEAAQVDLSATTVYVDNTAVGTTYVGGTTRSLYTMYDLTTGAATVVPAASVAGTGFASYSVDADGVYTFGATTALALADNGDGLYVADRAVEISLYNNLMSYDDGSSAKDFADFDASAAVVVNATGVPANAGLTLAKLDIATAVTANILVKDKAVVAVVVTAYTA